MTSAGSYGWDLQITTADGSPTPPPPPPPPPHRHHRRRHHLHRHRRHLHAGTDYVPCAESDRTAPRHCPRTDLHPALPSRHNPTRAFKTSRAGDLPASARRSPTATRLQGQLGRRPSVACWNDSGTQRWRPTAASGGSVGAEKSSERGHQRLTANNRKPDAQLSRRRSRVRVRRSRSFDLAVMQYADPSGSRRRGPRRRET